ncbi:MAG TPA: 4-(cytidine 5'-diphospho)-2-C-methyl-D-erythritol kinase [Caulobacteraceae bacterium]|nr:4-(cytidine 5'-diphospho)-2-C-methyl-D-erythritol kinase [Caulobacteraceae bacterium]
MSRAAFAPAKVNLFLHVGPVGADGFHALSSWMVFADVGDTVSLAPAETHEFAIDGPFGEAVPHDPDNSVLQARDAYLTATRIDPGHFRLLLTKRLPPASGIGGGSSDAAAALRLMEAEFGEPVPPLLPLALGSDVPACFRASPLIAEGRGEILNVAPYAPELHAVLVNPGVASPTGRVFAEYDAQGPAAGADYPDLPPMIASADEVAAILSICRNDLEAPAVRLTPEIGEVLDLVRDQHETLISRMSGSGATVFALCPGATEAESLAEKLRLYRPDWWIVDCKLGGPWDR